MGLSLVLTALIYSVGSMAITVAAEATLLGRPITASRAVGLSLDDLFVRLGRTRLASILGRWGIEKQVRIA